MISPNAVVFLPCAVFTFAWNSMPEDSCPVQRFLRFRSGAFPLSFSVGVEAS